MVRDGRLVARHDYGLADRSNQQRVNDRTIFHYGSITKTLTAIPNGGWNAPLTDLAAYSAFLANATRGDTLLRRRYDAVISRQSLEEMWRPVVSAGNSGAATQSVGLGFFLIQDGATRIIGHTGSQAGFLSFLWLNPATSTAIIVALNTDSEVPGSPSPLGVINREAVAMLRGGAIP